MVKFISLLSTRGGINQIISTVLATLVMVSEGMKMAWTSPAIPILLSSNSPIKIHESDIVWLEILVTISGLIGIPLTIFTVDKLGRKSMILIATIQSMVSWLMIGFTSSVEVLYAARFISGIAGSIGFIITTMYIAEIADPNIRGFLELLGSVFMLIGFVIVYSVVPFVSIMVSSSIGILFALLQLNALPFISESPYFLIMIGRDDEARRALQILRYSKDVEAEYQDISNAVRRELAETSSFKDLFLIQSNRKAVIITFTLNFFESFCAFSVLTMNLHDILNDVINKPLLDQNLVAILFSVLMLVSCIVGSNFIDQTGRRILLITSSLLTSFSLLGLALYFLLKNNGVDVTSYNWIPLLTILMYATVYKYGLSMVSTVYTAELFSSSLKAMGISLADVCYILGSVTSIYLFQGLSKLYGNHVPLFIFSACCVLIAIFTMVYIPETKGKSLEEIQIILKGNKTQN